MDPQLEYRRIVRESLFEWKQQTDGSFREWLLETVKTLAILNSAGLAGVSAIFASTSEAKALLGNYPSAACFAIGLMAAGFNMYFNARGFSGRHAEIVDRIKLLDEDSLDADRAIRQPTTKGERWFWAAEFAGWTSAATFVLGTWPFVKPAFGQIVRLACSGY